MQHLTASFPSTNALTSVMDLNNQAANLVLSGQHATAVPVLAKALTLFKQFCDASSSSLQDEYNMHQMEEVSKVDAVLSTKTRQDYERENNPEPFLFQEPLILVEATLKTGGGEHDEEMECPRTRSDMFHTVSLAIIVNIAICHQAHAMENPENRDKNLHKAVELYRHASKLLLSVGGDHQLVTEKQCNFPVELIILNNLGLAFTRLHESQQAKNCHDALFQATIRFKNSLSCYHMENDVVDLFYSFVFAKFLGIPSVASAA